MAISAQSETRAVDRVLQFTRDKFLPGIKNNAYNQTPLASILWGRLNESMFGERPMSGKGKRMSGGESVVGRVRLGKNDTAGTLTGPFDTLNTNPQSNIRFARANWKFYSAAITLSEHDMGVNSGVEALSSMVRDESSDAVNSLVDTTTSDAYTSAASGLTTLSSIVSAASETAAVHGLSGANYVEWNSRGLSARGTAAASVSFASGSFTGQGLSDMRTCYNNATEGTMRPDVVLTTWDVYGFYEGSLQPQERFNNTNAADGGFTNLQFKDVPILPDSKAPSGELYMLNFDCLHSVILPGFDYSVGPFERAEQQAVRVAKVLFTSELLCTGRKYQNKMTGITA